MPAEAVVALDECLLALFDQLGLARVHLAAGGPPALTDWHGLATRQAERVASLILPAPPILDTADLREMAPRTLVIAGDEGTAPVGANKMLAELPGVSAYFLHGYAWEPWSDVLAERGAEIAPVLLDFLCRHPLPPCGLAEGEGEAGGITYRIRGSGPPLVLLPLSLAPSQWEPMIGLLSAQYCTISLGGPLLGVVGILEGRGRSNYLAMVRTVLDAVAIQPGDTVLEVGGGSGVVLREVARRTAGANPIIDVDINAYLLREAASLAAKAGVADHMRFIEGSAEAIPLPADSVDVALSFTVMEEGDADRMLSELVRVTKPGGRIAAIVRATDMPTWTSPVLSAALRAKTDRPSGGAAPAGCADTSLYQRFHAAGLTDLNCFPQLTVLGADEVSRITVSKQRILASLAPDEAAEWHSATARSESEGTFFIATPHHCAIGTKPNRQT
jgi:SAM-dependent methyltransferase